MQLKPLHVIAIEFNTPATLMADRLVAELRDELMRLGHAFPLLSRAEVTLKKDLSIPLKEKKVCEITLTGFGTELKAYACTGGFARSARECLRALRKMVQEEVKRMKEGPDIVVSTVEV